MPYIMNATDRLIVLRPRNADIRIEPLGFAELNKSQLAELETSKVFPALRDRGQIVVSNSVKTIDPAEAVENGMITDKKKPEELKPAKRGKFKGGTVDSHSVSVETLKIPGMV